MTILLTIIHILVCLFLILVVLAQQGKGQDLASAFGGGGSSTAFGARGTATLLSKITTVAAVLFMLTSLGLTYLKPAMSGRTVVPATPAPEVQQPEPGTPEAPPAVEGEQAPGEEAAPPGETEKPTGEESTDKAKQQPPENQPPPPPKKKQ